MNKLTDQQIKQRLAEGRNYKRLYHELKVRYDDLKAENNQLKNQLSELAAKFEAVVETQAARIEELETMVFGRKPQGGSGTAARGHEQPASKHRSASSYRRPTPAESEITGERHYAVAVCRRCGHELAHTHEAVRYEEDIVLAALTPDAVHKTVTKQTIERGWCSACGQWSSARDLRGQLLPWVQ